MEQGRVVHTPVVTHPRPVPPRQDVIAIDLPAEARVTRRHDTPRPTVHELPEALRGMYYTG